MQVVRQIRRAVFQWLICGMALVALETGAQTLSSAERSEIVKQLTPVCRNYYAAFARCTRAQQEPHAAESKIDEELNGLAMLSFGQHADKGCRRQLNALHLAGPENCPAVALPDTKTKTLKKPITPGS